MLRNACIPAIGLLAMLWTTSTEVMAATVTGTIVELAPESSRITLKVGTKGLEKEYTLGDSVQVLVGTKKAEMGDLETGQSVTITTDKSDVVTKIVGKPVPGAAKKPSGGTASATRAGEVLLKGVWPQFRGPRRDGTSDEKGFAKSWPAGGPPLVYEAKGLGEGYSSVAIVDDKLFTQGTAGGEERLFCLEAATGKILWSSAVGPVFNDDQGNGPRGTPTVDGDRAYALGASGDLVCCAVADGKRVWRKNILQEFVADNITWGISESVLIDGDRLVCTPGGQKATMAALNKLTGEVEWTALAPGSPKAAYSSIIPAEVGGARQYVNFVHTGVIGVEAKTGKTLWGDTNSANGTANCSSPIFASAKGADFVFSSTGYGTGCALVSLQGGRGGTKATLAFKNKEIESHHGGMVLAGNYVYALSDPGVLICLDLTTGKNVWKNRSIGKGSIMMAEGQLYLRAEGDGRLALVEASPKGYKENGEFSPPSKPGANGQQRMKWAHPVVADKKLYIRDQDVLQVFSLKP